MSHVPYAAELFSGSVTGNGNSSSTPIITKWCKEGVFYLDVTAVGSGTTITVDLRTYDSAADNWHMRARWSGKASVGQDAGHIEFGMGEKMAVFYSFSGGTTTATFTVNAYLKEF